MSSNYLSSGLKNLMTLTFVHDNLSQDNPQTEKGFETVDEE